VVDGIRIFLKKRSEMLLAGSVFVVFLLIALLGAIRLSAGAIRELADSLIVSTDCSILSVFQKEGCCEDIIERLIFLRFSVL
jgi:hypothetical protein